MQFLWVCLVSLGPWVLAGEADYKPILFEHQLISTDYMPAIDIDQIDTLQDKEAVLPDDILDIIMEHADLQDLTTWRSVSKNHLEKADRLLNKIFKHLLKDYGFGMHENIRTMKASSKRQLYLYALTAVKWARDIDPLTLSRYMDYIELDDRDDISKQIVELALWNPKIFCYRPQLLSATRSSHSLTSALGYPQILFNLIYLYWYRLLRLIPAGSPGSRTVRIILLIILYINACVRCELEISRNCIHSRRFN